MKISLTYLAVTLLTMIGVDNAESVANAALIIATAVIALYGRYRAGGVNPFGIKK